MANASISSISSLQGVNDLKKTADVSGVSMTGISSGPKEISFKTVLEREKEKIDNFPGLEQINMFMDRWSSAEAASIKQIEQLPTEAKSMLKLQVLVQRLGLEAELMTKAGDSFTGTVKRVQQMGSS